MSYKFFQKDGGHRWVNIGEKSYPCITPKEIGDLIYKVLMGEFKLSESDKKELHLKLTKLLQEQG